VRIMCLNAWGGTLYDQLIAYLRHESPDILCLQEVVHTPATRKETLIYRDGDHGLRQRANLFRDVATALSDHVATFCPAAQGVLWDGSDQIPSQWGLATFVRTTFPILAQHHGFVHKSFSPTGYGQHPRSRTAHAIRVYDFERGWPICVAHMHGLRDPGGKMDTPERLAQSRKFAAMCKAILEDGDRLVVCGDFNVEPSSTTFEVLAEIGLADLVTSRGFADTRTSHYRKAVRYADYMLVNGRVEPKAFEVVALPEVSDHRPMVLEI
jgi:endonuclease/exonuclease/phosphatase family metal-dependent hydrolase